MKKRFCSPDVELLCVGMCPYFLPRELTSAIVVAVPPPHQKKHWRRRRKLESKLQQNYTRDVWTGMREITGFNVKDRQPVSSPDRAC